MLIPRAAWINLYDTREFEYSAEDYTVSLEGIFGYIRPNTRGARVTNSNGEEMVVQDPGIIDAYLRYNGEKIYLVLRFVLLYGIVIKSVFYVHNYQVWRWDGNYYNWDWQPANTYGTEVNFLWCSANIYPDRIYYRDDYRNLIINKDDNLNPPVEQVFPYEIVLAGEDNQTLHNKSAYSIDWRVTNFSPSSSYIPWQDVPLSGTLNYADCYRWKGFDNDGYYPLPDRPMPPMDYMGSSFNYQGYLGLYRERFKSNSRYIFNPYNSLQPYEVAIELELGQSEQCDIPISVDPIYRDRDYFCMSFGEYNQLMNRFPQMNQNMDTTNSLLRG